MNKFLETKNITKTFGKLKALDDVNFNLYRGKIHGLLGENGAGKSSLMNVLSGIYQPDKGSIYLDGGVTCRRWRFGLGRADNGTWRRL